MKDIEVEMTFLTAEEGGRHIPTYSEYRPQFYYDGHDWDAVHTYIGTDQVRPGQTVRAYLAFLSPEMHLGRIHPGMEFLIREGARTVARGRVLQVLELEASARNVSEKKLVNLIYWLEDIVAGYGRSQEVVSMLEKRFVECGLTEDERFSDLKHAIAMYNGREQAESDLVRECRNALTLLKAAKLG